MSVESSLPKLKSNVKAKVKLPATAASEKKEKPAKAKADKPVAKKAETKPAKTSKAAAKPAKAVAPKKAEAKASKAAPKAAKGKGTALTNDGVANAISNTVATGKVAAAGKVDYASSASVLEALTAKAAGVLLKAYSDKAISAVTHGDSDIAKSIKEVVAKNASTVRATAVAKHAKKMAPAIVKAAKAADAGKLTASDFRAIVFAV